MIVPPHLQNEWNRGYVAAANGEPFNDKETRSWQAGYIAWESAKWGEME